MHRAGNRKNGIHHRIPDLMGCFFFRKPPSYISEVYDNVPFVELIMIKIVSRIVLALLLVLAFAGCHSLISPARPLPPDKIPSSIAVTTFENRSGFSGQWELGQGVADLLVSELVLSKNFEVLERAQLGRILDEIDMQRNGYFRSEGKVAKGRLKNAQYLIRGVVTDFSQVSGGSLWLRMQRFLVGGRAYTARVGLTLTIMEVESGRIVDSVQCAGNARAKSAYGAGNYDDVKFGGDMFFKTPLGRATSDALRQGLKGIIAKVPQNSWVPVIAAVVNAEIIINGGSNRGLKTGQVYQVRGTDSQITDPLTGDVLTTLPGSAVALIRIVSVAPSSSSAVVIKGAAVERGQRLTLIPSSVPHP